MELISKKMLISEKNAILPQVYTNHVITKIDPSVSGLCIQCQVRNYLRTDYKSLRSSLEILHIIEACWKQNLRHA
jgi:hypothetical protein